MKICVVQTQALKGDIAGNIARHIQFAELAVDNGANMIVFPELSVTGYEPTLAATLATTATDERLDCFQDISDRHQVTICIGLPTRSEQQPFISMIIFQPDKERLTYSKQYLYPTEVDYFSPGTKAVFLHPEENTVIAPAICYELSVPQHAENAHNNGTSVYIASVLNSIGGIDNDLKRLADIARNYSMTTFMANYVGESGGYTCAGKSSVWHSDGTLARQLDDKNEGILIYDTQTQISASYCLPK
jgi:predicted amidohydrolase